MNDARRLMRARAGVVFTTLAIVGLGLNSLAAQQPKGDSKPETDETIVHRLKYTKAQDLAAIIRDLYKDSPITFRVVADPASNSLIISTSTTELGKIKTVIAELDVERPKAAPVADSIKL